jgi:hypothetical protein
MAPEGDFSGSVLDPRSLAAGCALDPSEAARVVSELQRVGLVATVPLLRVRGLDRYAAAWRKNRKSGQRPPVSALVGSGSAAEPARKTETETDTSTALSSQAPLLEVPDSLSNDITDVWEHWKATLNHPRAVLDDPRLRLIKARLKTYSVVELQHAIDGCAANRLANPELRAHDGIGLILRNAEKIEMFQAMRPR